MKSTPERTLKGKTLFVTGASRGIGLAIAKRAASDGANIVLVAKTTVANPKLPGTLYSAAAEIEAAGGQALAVPTSATTQQLPQRSRPASRASAASTFWSTTQAPSV